MGGDKDSCDLPSLDSGSRTVLLLGRTGNGKSATGNSILGKTAFESKMSFGGVTSSAESLTRVLTNGDVVNVIDTPGLFDFHVGSEFISKEILKCVTMAKDGIHAVLLVFSLRGRFTEEEAAVIESLRAFFGPKITDYMIVVFTGGDCMDSESQQDILVHLCPKPLERILGICKNRMVVFDNKTEDEIKKALQLEELLSLVDSVIEENGGQPYTDKMLSEYREKELKHKQQIDELTAKGHSKQELKELTEKIENSNDEVAKRTMNMVESKLKEETEKLKLKLKAEKAAHLKAEKAAKDTLKKAEDEARKLRQKLERARNDENAARLRAEQAPKDVVQVVRDGLAIPHKVVHDFVAGGCAIM